MSLFISSLIAALIKYLSTVRRKIDWNYGSASLRFQASTGFVQLHSVGQGRTRLAARIFSTVNTKSQCSNQIYLLTELTNLIIYHCFITVLQQE